MTRPKKLPIQVKLYIDARRLSEWRRVAVAYGMTLSGWIRFVCDSSARCPTPKTDRFLMGKR